MTDVGGEHLDALAEQVFGGERGRARLAPLLARFEAAVGTFTGHGPEAGRWHEVRTDWALCDAALDHPFDTWIRRLGAQTDAPETTRILARQGLVSVFDAGGRPRPWLVDMLRGVEGPLLGPGAETLASAGHETQLWEARVICTSAGWRLVRPPVMVEGALRARFYRGRLQALRTDAPLDLAWLRRGRLRRQGNPRLSLSAAYGD